MKNVIMKIAKAIDVVYGWGIMLALILGGLTFLGYLSAFIIGGETAAAISKFIYKGFFPVIIYITNILVVLGLVSMYLKREKTLTITDEKKEATDTSQVAN